MRLDKLVSHSHLFQGGHVFKTPGGKLRMFFCISFLLKLINLKIVWKIVSKEKTQIYVHITNELTIDLTIDRVTLELTNELTVDLAYYISLM